MHTDTQGHGALRNLRQELQDEVGHEFPDGAIDQLLVLYDVCKSLDMNYFEAKGVLGQVGFEAVLQHINSPIPFIPSADTEEG